MPAADRSRWAHSRSRELDPWREHDACGVGFVARASGQRSAEIARLALQALARVAHRGAAATDRSGDGAGLLTQIPAPLFYREAAIAAPDGGRHDDTTWERSLYLARRTIERRIADAGPGLEPFFVCSLSCRMLAHNGEINTLWGNRNAMLAREPALAGPPWGDAVDRLKPVIWSEGSDSASLDNALELLVRSGRDPVHALMMLVPEAHEGAVEMEPALRGFYEFHECLVEPWDGPAALAFSDGVFVGSALDRNGLRPCRYKITRDGLVVAGSESGLVDLNAADVVESGRLGP